MPTCFSVPKCTISQLKTDMLCVPYFGRVLAKFREALSNLSIASFILRVLFSRRLGDLWVVSTAWQPWLRVPSRAADGGSVREKVWQGSCYLLHHARLSIFDHLQCSAVYEARTVTASFS